MYYCLCNISYEKFSGVISVENELHVLVIFLYKILPQYATLWMGSGWKLYVLLMDKVLDMFSVGQMPLTGCREAMFAVCPMANKVVVNYLTLCWALLLTSPWELLNERLAVSGVLGQHWGYCYIISVHSVDSLLISLQQCVLGSTLVCVDS